MITGHPVVFIMALLRFSALLSSASVHVVKSPRAFVVIEREEKCRSLLARNRKKKVIKLRQTTLFWTDDEVQLLLEVTNDYKVSKAATGSRASQSTLTFLNYIGNITHHLKKSLQKLKKNTHTRKKRSLRSYWRQSLRTFDLNSVKPLILESEAAMEGSCSYTLCSHVCI